MNVGDFVHNVPHSRFGVIIEELEPITDPDGYIAERRLLVLYSDPVELLVTGDGFLDVIKRAV